MDGDAPSGSSSPQKAVMGGMSPVLYPSSRTDGSPRNDHQFDADGGIRAQTATTRETNPKDPIEGFDWAELEQRYLARIHDCEQAEKDIYDDFQQWYQVRHDSPRMNQRLTQEL